MYRWRWRRGDCYRLARLDYYILTITDLLLPRAVDFATTRRRSLSISLFFPLRRRPPVKFNRRRAYKTSWRCCCGARAETAIFLDGVSSSTDLRRFFRLRVSCCNHNRSFFLPPPSRWFYRRPAGQKFKRTRDGRSRFANAVNYIDSGAAFRRARSPIILSHCRGGGRTTAQHTTGTPVTTTHNSQRLPAGRKIARYLRADGREDD